MKRAKLPVSSALPTLVTVAMPVKLSILTWSKLTVITMADLVKSLRLSVLRELT